MKQGCCGEKNGKSINREKVGRDADSGEGYLRLFCDEKKIKIPGPLMLLREMMFIVKS